jgi:hypothetical protein
MSSWSVLRDGSESDQIQPTGLSDRGGGGGGAKFVRLVRLRVVKALAEFDRLLGVVKAPAEFARLGRVLFECIQFWATLPSALRLAGIGPTEESIVRGMLCTELEDDPENGKEFEEGKNSSKEPEEGPRENARLSSVEPGKTGDNCVTWLNAPIWAAIYR